MTVTLDKLANGFVPFQIYKASVTTKGAGLWQSHWKTAGFPLPGSSGPAFGSGSGYTPDNTTVGGLLQALVTSGNEKYVGQFALTAAQVGSFILMDRLFHCSGLLTNTTSTQTIVTPGTLPSARNPNSGADVYPFIEINTPPGATGATWTLTGTDSSGTTGRTWTYTHPASAEVAGQLCPMIPGTAVGGCRVPTSFACSVSSGTAGDVGVVLARHLTPPLGVPLVNVATMMDTGLLGNPRVYDGACIFLVEICGAATSGIIQGQVGLSEITP